MQEKVRALFAEAEEYDRVSRAKSTGIFSLMMTPLCKTGIELQGMTFYRPMTAEERELYQIGKTYDMNKLHEPFIQELYSKFRHGRYMKDIVYGSPDYHNSKSFLLVCEIPPESNVSPLPTKRSGLSPGSPPFHFMMAIWLSHSDP